MQKYQDALAYRPILHTVNFLLRTPTDEDIPAIVAVAGDWEVARCLSRMPHPFGEEEARVLLADVVPTELVWVIVERRSGCVVGLAALGPPKGEAATLDLGYFIARDHWGRGIATEAASAVVAYGVGLVGRQHISANFFTDNPASGRILEKLGFIELSRAESFCVAAGTTKPILQMALIRPPSCDTLSRA